MVYDGYLDEKTCVLGWFVFFLMRRRPPRSTQSRSSAASDVYKRQEVLRGDARAHRARIRDPHRLRLLLDERLGGEDVLCLLYTSPSPRDRTRSRMPSSA